MNKQLPQLLTLMLLMAALLLSNNIQAEEISFNERFVLDRAAALQELIPGTEDYYYYTALDLELQGKLAASKKIIDAGVKKYGHSTRLQELENRHALKVYAANPDDSLKYIRRNLDLRFDHQQQKLRPEKNLPTKLDQGLISFATLAKQAFQEKRHTQGFKDSAFDYLVIAPLTPDQRRNLLSRLRRPDYPGLVQMIIDDLKYQQSQGFGSHPVHRMLTISQLEQCLKLQPELIKQTDFIHTYLSKLRPNDDVNWQADEEEHAAYLQRLLAFADRLPPAQNSLKANIIYNRLAFNLGQGILDAALFLRYIQLPRPVPYINQNWLQRSEHRNAQVNLHASYQQYIDLEPISDDEQLVRRHLAALLKEAPDFKKFDDYIEYNYLKRLFAEVKLVNAEDDQGDPEQWYALMDDPALVKRLRDRVDIEILPENRTYLGLDDKVALQVALKNIRDLTVKVYAINTTGYYRQKGTEITTAIELDGLVPNQQRIKQYSQPPMRRHRETLTFPELSKPGAYVIELIGNGVSSRALIRKGRISFSQRIGAAGHVFTLYDGAGNPLNNGLLWMAGTEYRAEKGEIHVPLSANPKTQAIVLTADGFSVLREFQHQAENYQLKAAISLDREQLIAGKQCTVTIRPELLVNGEPIDIKLLEDPILTIRSQDQDYLSAEKQVNDFTLENDKESSYSFRVPKRLDRITISLSGTIQYLNRGEKRELTTETTISANQIKQTEKIEDLFLRRTAEGYLIELLGRNGEARADRPVQLQLKHRDFQRVVQTSLKTDAQGRVNLGELKDIVWVEAENSEKTLRDWQLPQDKHSHPPLLHLLAREQARIPIMVKGSEHGDKPLNQLASLLETRAGVFVRDCKNNMTLQDGYLVLHDLEPGNYSLMTKPDRQITTIRVTQGRAQDSQLLGQNRILERKASFPLQIRDITVDDDTVEVQLSNAVPGTRVHLTMSRYVTTDLFSRLGSPALRPPTATDLNRPQSQYLSGRKIGDEYRYIMERRKSPAYPGNMLTRPSLLLNPWSPRTTELSSDSAKGGEAYQALAPQKQWRSSDDAVADAMLYAKPSSEQSSSFDFLKEGSPQVINLIPDANGVVKVLRKQLARGQHLHVYAVNGTSSVYRQQALAERPEQPQDLRLRRNLDPATHFTEQKRSSILRQGESFTVADIRSAKVEVIDSVASAYRLFTALNDDPTLAEFNFISNWPEHSLDKKKELYKKYSSHELHLFLAQKDPEFFNKVVRPYLTNKKDKQFLDDWLLERPLQKYLEPWAYDRLNIVERALLAQRIKEQRTSTARHLKDLYDLLPPDAERFNRLFDAALRSSGLEENHVGYMDDENMVLEETEEDSIAETAWADGLASNMSEPNSKPMPARVKASISASVKKESRQAEEQPMPDMALMDAAAPPAEKKDIGAMLSAQISKGKKRRDLAKRKSVRQLYRKLEKSKEWVENNYYHQALQPLQANTAEPADLITINGFWKDYAAWNGQGPFLSGNLFEANNSFTEIMLALALLDLPFEAGEHEYQYKDDSLVLTAASDLILFHRQVLKALKSQGKSQEVLLVNQSFFAQDNRYRYPNNERFDKFISKEFEQGRIYGCQLVITNPTSTKREVDVLQQIPAGAIPVLNGMRTRSHHAVLEPYSTQSQEYYFYFPQPGIFPHYPVHVAQNEEVVAAAEPFVFTVKAEVDERDKESWEHISQFGSEDEVIAFLNKENIERLDLEMIAWRMQDKGFFNTILSLLSERKKYDHSLWSYSLFHNQPERIRQFLPRTSLADNSGMVLDAPLLKLDPIIRHVYEHKEYWPLVNARTFKLGNKRKILNHQFHSQYESFIKTLTYCSALTEEDKMTLAVYMLLQDRIAEAMHWYQAIDPAKTDMTIQYDYLTAYLAMYRGTPDKAKAIANKYRDYPVKRWQDLFQTVLAQCAEIAGDGIAGDEIAGTKAALVDEEDRSQTQTLLADASPHLQVELEGGVLQVEHSNLTGLRVNYFPMDLELLFSRQPFVQDLGTRFTVIKPFRSDELKINDEQPLTIRVPDELKDRNLMIEVAAAGISRVTAYYPNQLKVELIESYGRLRVADKESGNPLSKVYVKVYARSENGTVAFYKDGYTDLRGRFDYTSLNSGELDSVSRFAVLILSEEHGALVREVGPPQR
ncbi:MAG: hypothetical protein Q3M30_19350 [Candidatus Electrothrix sp. Rat3]|nr:hypothetical protein [Candidatus Electrothrix rattekaaiensis]